MWFYKPGLSKPIAISQRQKLMGQAAYGDIASTNYAKDYTAEPLPDEFVNGEECYVFELHSNNDKTTYDLIKYWISKKRIVGIKAEYYTVSAKKFKIAEMSYDNTVLIDGEDFETGYALKIDWTGEGKYFSVIPSYREDTGYRIGYFGGWSVTDAILLYSEGSDGDYDNLKLQMGGSYTFEGGAEVHIEYFHNGHGCVGNKIDRCFRDGDVGFDDPFLRSDYLMLQYNKRDILHDFSVNRRLLYGLNDQSAQLNPILEYAVGEHTQLYLVGTGFMGDRNTEYGSLLKYSLFGGVSYTF